MGQLPPLVITAIGQLPPLVITGKSQLPPLFITATIVITATGPLPRLVTLHLVTAVSLLLTHLLLQGEAAVPVDKSTLLVRPLNLVHFEPATFITAFLFFYFFPTLFLYLLSLLLFPRAIAVDNSYARAVSAFFIFIMNRT